MNEHIFEDWKIQQMNAMSECAFETNFRSKEVIDTVKKFKNNGYETRLLFLGLDSIEAAIERVRLRVAGGGHSVSLENIKANYIEGLENLKLFFQNFDSVDLLQNFSVENETIRLTPLMKIKNGIIIEQANWQPTWVKLFADHSFGGVNKSE